MSDLSGRLSGGQAISGSLSGGSVLRGGLSMGGVSPAVLLDKADVITDSASGSIVSISDGMASPVLGLDVEIEPIQDLHGYDNPWPAGGGKNKCSMQDQTFVQYKEVEIEPIIAGTYIYSAVVTSDDTDTNKCTIAFLDAEKTTIVSKGIDRSVGGARVSTSAFTASVPIKYVRLYASGGYPSGAGDTATFKDNMLEEGSTATTYAPYSNLCPISGRSEVNVYVEETYDPQATPKATIQLGQTVYGGTVDVTEGKLVIDKAYDVLDTTRSWTKSSSYPGGYFTTRDFPAGRAKGSTPFICSHAKTATSTSQYVRGTCYCDGSMNFRLMAEDSTLQDWLNYIESQTNAGTPIQICYTLETPVEVTLTPQELDILFGDNNIWADSGNVSVDYRCDTKKYILKKIAEALNA